jgi:hypothetical protein
MASALRADRAGLGLTPEDGVGGKKMARRWRGEKMMEIIKNLRETPRRKLQFVEQCEIRLHHPNLQVTPCRKISRCLVYL